METRAVYDPFHGTDVHISDKLTDRLRGKYACGPMLATGDPEFGWRQMPQIPIQVTAADRIEELEHALWLLVGDVEAMHRSHVPGPGEPPITRNEVYHLERAKALLSGYEPQEK